MHVHSVQPRPVREEHTFTQALRLGHEVAERPSPFLCHCATPCFIAFPIELIALLGHHFRCLFQLVFPPVHGYHSNRFRRNKRLIVSAGLVQEVIVHTAPPMHISKSKIHSPFRSRDEEELNYGVLGGMKCTVSYEKLMTQR